MNTYLRDILPFDLFKQMLDGGYIRSQVHPLHPELVIFNYTEAAQFDRVWNAATNVCRGLIVVVGPNGLDEDAVVLARPFNKFHNLNTTYVPETMEANLPTDAPPLVTAKLDGSMGIIFEYKGEWTVATRGSFDSDQSRWATAWYRSHPVKPEWAAGYTPICEIIYQKNRIVVDYDFEGLILLSMIEISTGAEASRAVVEESGMRNAIPAVPVFNKSLAQCAAEDNPNEEGYVLTYSNGVKVKVKFADYVRLHRILTGLNPRSIWELLEAGKKETVDSLLADEKMPEGFRNWLRDWATELMVRYTQLEHAAQDVYMARPATGDRKANALYFKTQPHLASICFAMLDGKDHAPIIWDRVKPAGNATFKKDGE